jgi:hypothetical protein
MLLFPESGPKKDFRVTASLKPRPRNPGLKGLSGNGFTRTVTPHLRSIVPNVQRHMAYFAVSMCAPLRRSMPAGCCVRPCVSMCARSRVEGSEESSIGESAMPIPVYIQNANLPKSRIPSTLSLLPTRDISPLLLSPSPLVRDTPLFSRDTSAHLH